MVETFIALFAAHVALDFVLKVNDNDTSNLEVGTLAARVVIILYVVLLFTGSASWPVLFTAVLISLSQVLDAKKQRFLSLTLLDQGARITTLFALAYFNPDIWSEGVWNTLPAWVSHALLMTSGAIYITIAGDDTISKLVEPYSERLNDTNGVLLQNGKIIGHLERGIVAALILTDHWEGIGFILAAKVVMRFQTRETTIEENEYVYIGTLASIGWAIFVTLAIQGLLSQLPTLGFPPHAS